MARTYLGGTLSFKAGGVPYDLAGSFSYDLGGLQREMRVGPSGVNGTTGKFYAATVDCELQDSGALSIAQIQALDGITLTLELGNGKTVVFFNASQIGEIPNDVVETKIKAKFGAISAQELPNG